MFDVHTYIIQDRRGYGLIVQKESFFLYLFFGGGWGGVSVCVNADRTGQLAPPLFYK